MPLPFALAAGSLIYGSTTGASSATTAAVLGTATGGGVSAWLAWLFFRNKPPELTAEHQASLAAQSTMTTERIDEATRTVVEARDAVNSVATAINLLAEKSARSAESLHQSSDLIVEASVTLLAADQAAQNSSERLTALAPNLHMLLQRMQEENQVTAARLDALILQLNKRDEQIAQAQSDIAGLTHTINEQAAVMAELGDAVQTLETENARQAQIIVTQKHTISQLEEQSGRALDQLSIFKAIAKKTMAKKNEDEQQHSGPKANGMN